MNENDGNVHFFNVIFLLNLLSFSCMSAFNPYLWHEKFVWHAQSENAYLWSLSLV